ncbi:hypothetical protein BHE74_00002465 [Ensete ventricosum]|uniref:Uncharacterized protein n=1 Tax=Ensete ventricosum TaxID=4639 RepID=A0A444FR59_ENSVE|nr:hypothetical protein B296_00000069 [Ensete ventricosum]RWW25092.1 hypothetical protein GW17_00010590 [Ensete ventricosum]RWW88651.1 hypothetical protein BHE74_00002465 [Ensete ventricosum]RZR70708.1 hypothetical protein BHM03_00001109 [Ensete ventricosum]
MGGSQSSSKSSSCLFFKPKYRVEETEHEPRYVSRKIRPSDEDRTRWVGDPNVDSKASAFIANFKKIRLMDPQSYTSSVVNPQSHETCFTDAEGQKAAV